jgi:hypothetical protein
MLSVSFDHVVVSAPTPLLSISRLEQRNTLA